MANLTDTSVNGDLRVTGTMFGTQAGNYATCATAAATAAKAVTISGFTLTTGIHVFVKFTVTNTAAVASLTLNVSSTGAKAMKYRGGNLPAVGTLSANRVYEFIYDGTNWELVGDLDTQTVTGVKGSNESTYRTGQVSISKTDVGLGSVVNTGDSATPEPDGTTKFTTGGAYTELAKKAPTNHASTATTYGVGTTANYGHVKLDNSTPLTVGTSSADGVATGKAHIHNALESVARASVTTADLAHINTNTRAHMILSQISGETSTTHDPGDGYMLTFMWDNSSSYDAQIHIPASDTSDGHNWGRLKMRYRNNGSWGDWSYLKLSGKGTLLTSSDNLNNIKGDGEGNVIGYYWQNPSVPTNNPFTDTYGAEMLVFGTSATDYCIQLVFRASGGIYQRRLVNGTWGSWEKVLTSADMTLYDARRHHTNESGNGWGKIAEWTGDISGNSLTAEWDLFTTTRGTRWTSIDGVINLNIYGGNASDIPQIGTFDVVCTEDIKDTATFALVVTGTASACTVQLYAYAATYTSIAITMTGNGKVAADAYKTGWTYTDSTGGGGGKPTADASTNKYVYDPRNIFTGILHEGIGRRAVYWLGTDNTGSSAPGWVKFATVKKLDNVDYQGFRLSGYFYYNQGNLYATANASRFHFQAVFNATNSTAKIFYGPTNMSVSSAIRIVKVAESPLTWELQLNFGTNNMAYAVYASYEGNPTMFASGAIKMENSVVAGSAAIGDPMSYEKDGRWDSAYAFSTDTSVGAANGTAYRVLGVAGTSANYYKPALLPYLKMEGSTTYGNVLSVGNSSGTTAETDKGRVFLADGAGHSMKIGTHTLSENRDIFFPNASGTVALQNGTYSGMTVGTATNSTNSMVSQANDKKLYIVGAENYGSQQALKTDTGIYATTTSGQLRATTYSVNGSCILQYNSTTNALDFVFA